MKIEKQRRMLKRRAQRTKMEPAPNDSSDPALNPILTG